MSRFKMQILSVPEFVDILIGVNRSLFAGIQTVTEPKLTKKHRDTGEPWAVVFPGVDPATVRKVAHGVVLTGPDYSAIIERRHEKIEAAGGTHGEYVPGETWHEAVPGIKCLRRHKKTGELYAYFAFVSKVRKGDRWIPLKAKTRILDMSSGIELDKGKLAGFLPVERAPQNQGLDTDEAVIVRTYKLESVRAITIGGTVYTIVAK